MVMEFWKITQDRCSWFEFVDGKTYFPSIYGAMVYAVTLGAGNFYEARMRKYGKRYDEIDCYFEIYEKDGKHYVSFTGYQDYKRFYSADRYLKKYRYEIMCIANGILYHNALPYNGTRPCEA